MKFSTFTLVFVVKNNTLTSHLNDNGWNLRLIDIQSFLVDFYSFLYIWNF